MRRAALLLLAASTLHLAPLAHAETPTIEAARTLFRTPGKSAEAQAAFEAIAQAQPDHHAAQFHLGLLAFRRDDMDAAIRHLERAVALAPNDGDSIKAVGDAYGRSAQKASVFKQLGFAKKCVAAYERAVALAPNRVDFRQSLFEYYFRAPGLAGGGRDKAVAQASEIKRLDAHAGRIVFARIAIEDKKFPEAFAQFDEVLNQSPDDYAALYQVGRIAALTGQEIDRGIRSLQRCLELKPPTAPNTPSHANAQWRLGQLHEKKNDRAAARAAYEKSLQLDPNFAPAKESLAKLK